MKIAFCLIALLLASGCMSHNGAETKASISTTSATSLTSTTDGPSTSTGLSGHPNSTNRSPVPGHQHTMSLASCYSVATLYLGDRAKMQALMPSGYVVMGTGPATTAGTAMDICQTVILDNRTILHDVGFAVTSVVLDQAPANKSATGSNAFIFETFATSPNLTAWLQDRGFAATFAKIGISNSTAEEATVVSNDVNYDFKTGPDAGNRSPVIEQDYRRHVASGQRQTWADVKQFAAVTQAYGPLAATFTGGALSAISPTPGTSSGLVSYALDNYEYVFEEE